MSEAFTAALLAQPGKRVVLDVLRRLWVDAHPEQVQHPARDKEMLAHLEVLATEQRLALPAAASFDRRSTPPLPRFVTLIRERALPRADYAALPWAPELGFWPSLSTSELECAARINAWLLTQRGKSHPVVPLRERALEIFGDEKFLDARVRGNALFAGRLPLAALSARAVALPLPCHRANARGRPLLVVENHHTYWSFGHWNERVGRYAGVAYGAGKAFAATGQGLAQALEDCSAPYAEYFGDLDPAGLVIPQQYNAVEVSKVRPAIDLYAWLLEHGHRRSPVNWQAYDDRISYFLGPLAGAAVTLWKDNHWIPQESLGMEQLMEFSSRNQTEGGCQSRGIRLDLV